MTAQALLGRYHQLNTAAESKRRERDAIGLIDVPYHDPRHLDSQPEQARRRWSRLDAEMWVLREEASAAWEAYAHRMLHPVTRDDGDEAAAPPSTHTLS